MYVVLPACDMRYSYLRKSDSKKNDTRYNACPPSYPCGCGVQFHYDSADSNPVCGMSNNFHGHLLPNDNHLKGGIATYAIPLDIAEAYIRIRLDLI